MLVDTTLVCVSLESSLSGDEVPNLACKACLIPKVAKLLSVYVCCEK